MGARQRNAIGDLAAFAHAQHGVLAFRAGEPHRALGVERDAVGMHALGQRPRGRVVQRPDGALALLRQARAQQLVRNAAGQSADLGEGVTALVLEVGRALRIDAPAAVEEVDDGHGMSWCVSGKVGGPVHAAAVPVAVIED
jgi:hypothetical protein